MSAVFEEWQKEFTQEQVKQIFISLTPGLQIIIL
jgi:hypothetical protein